MTPNIKIAAVIVGAGKATRFGGKIPKQYQLIDHECSFTKNIRFFENHPNIHEVISVIAAEHEEIYRSSCRVAKKTRVVFGGEDRQSSVKNALDELSKDKPDFVIIHDAARPFLKSKVLETIISNFSGYEAIIPVLKISDTLKLLNGSYIDKTVDRNLYGRAQTPQGFKFLSIFKAHETLGDSFQTDDSGLLESMGATVLHIDGDEDLFKITYEKDLERARLMAGNSSQTRVGFGYDVHQFGSGTEVILCGIPVTYTKSLLGHSDADVALHALTDAILGAMGMGDIGDHFPATEKEWSGKPSRLFLEFALNAVQEKNARIVNADLTIICEEPKIGPFKGSMTKRLAELLEVQISQVNLKATTTEGLGSIGRQEGIAANAIVSIAFPIS